MDSAKERAALLALLRERRTGWSKIADAVEDAGSALQVLLTEPADDGQTALPGMTLSLSTDALLQRAEEAIRGWAKQGVNLVTLLDAAYPEQLRGVHQRPPFLFYRGVLHKGDANGVAVVGTRKPSERGLRRADEIASGLARAGVSVVSGLAAGIDRAAHCAAMAAGGRTVAVIGTGILRAYPADNAALQERIASEHLVLSQFWPEASPTKQSFPMRNAVMSGYAAATVVVEAAYRSGARMQARLALEHGRPVFLMKDLMEHDWARAFAERPGAYVVSTADEVLASLEGLREGAEGARELVWS